MRENDPHSERQPGSRWLDGLVRNIRFALRLLRRDRVFAFTAILTLALCIGVNTAVYSVIDAVFLRPLPYPQPDRLAKVVTSFQLGGRSGTQEFQTGKVWEALRDGASRVRPAATGLATGVNLEGAGAVENVVQERVSAGYFEVLGVAPLRGRGFTEDEDREGGPSVAVLGYDIWQRVFSGDNAIVGRRVMLRGEPWTVVGVMPPGFITPSKADVWTPLRASRAGEGGGSNYSIIARLAPGAAWAEAEAEMRRLSPGIFDRAELPPGARVHLHLVSLQEGLSSSARMPLMLVWAAVGVVLLIGCANIASLLLARGATRRREMATRVALGGGRRALTVQLLTESVVLAVIGGLAGVGVGALLLRAMSKPVSDAFQLWQPIALDLRVLAGSLVLTLASVMLFGLVPALRVASVDVRSALSDAGGRGVAGSSRQWPRRLLVMAQVSLGLALLMGAALLVRTAIHLYTQPPGFDPRQVAATSVSLQDARYGTNERVSALFDRTLRAMRSLPGVTEAGVGLTLPYERALNVGVALPGTKEEPEPVNVVYITPGYFEALRVALLQGRIFADRDAADTQPVVVANAAFVRRHLGSRPPLGLEVQMSGTSRVLVGVVGDVQQSAGYGNFGPLAAVPCLYVPVSQLPDGMLSLIHTWFSPRWVVRTAGPLGGHLASLQQAIAASDPLLPFAPFKPVSDFRGDSLADQRLQAQVLAGMALLALLQVFVGLYGLVASGVAERSHELGVRLALGASRSHAIRTVVGPVLALVTAGTAVGAGLSALLVPVLKRFVWGISPTDPLSIVVVLLTTVVVGLVASLLPAWRITRLDPAHVLRND